MDPSLGIPASPTKGDWHRQHSLTCQLMEWSVTGCLLVFLELRKSYNNLDRSRILQTLEEYRVGPEIRGILDDFWLCQEVLTPQKGYHGPQFRDTRVTNQGRLASPTLFNLPVDGVVRHWLSMKVEDDAFIQDRLGHAVGWRLGVFYENYVTLGLLDPGCIQGGLNVLIGLFLWIGVMTNITKSKIMTCQPGTIRSGMLEEAFGWKSTRKGDTCIVFHSPNAGWS